MRKRNHLGTIAMVVIALAVSAAALYRPLESAPARAATPTATPTPSASLLGIKAYTDSPGTDYYGNCFQQEGASKKTLYLKAYAALPVKPGTATLGLYHYEADGSLKSLQVTAKYYYYGNVVKIEVTDSAPPHLGPGPYDAVISTDLTLPGAAKTTVTGSTYYDTYKSDFHECWRE
jgi:hypothetical protein